MVEERIRQLEIDVAVVKSQMQALTEAVQENTKAQIHLADIMSRSKGAWAVLIGLIGAAAFAADFIFRLFGK